MYYIKRDSTLVDGVQWYECWLAKEEYTWLKLQDTKMWYLYSSKVLYMGRGMEYRVDVEESLFIMLKLAFLA